MSHVYKELLLPDEETWSTGLGKDHVGMTNSGHSMLLQHRSNVSRLMNDIVLENTLLIAFKKDHSTEIDLSFHRHMGH